MSNRTAHQLLLQLPFLPGKELPVLFSPHRNTPYCFTKRAVPPPPCPGHRLHLQIVKARIVIVVSCERDVRRLKSCWRCTRGRAPRRCAPSASPSSPGGNPRPSRLHTPCRLLKPPLVRDSAVWGACFACVCCVPARLHVGLKSLEEAADVSFRAQESKGAHLVSQRKITLDEVFSSICSYSWTYQVGW